MYTYIILYSSIYIAYIYTLYILYIHYTKPHNTAAYYYMMAKKYTKIFIINRNKYKYIQYKNMYFNQAKPHIQKKKKKQIVHEAYI